MRRVRLLIPVTLLAGCALVSRIFPPPSEPPDEVSAAALRLPGAESLVAGIALDDLLRTERAEIAELGGFTPDGGIRDPDDGGTPDQDGGWIPLDAFLARCYLNPATYEVWVELASARNRWKVVLMPRAECTKDVFGGGAFYEIDASSFEILNRERFE